MSVPNTYEMRELNSHLRALVRIEEAMDDADEAYNRDVTVGLSDLTRVVEMARDSRKAVRNFYQLVNSRAEAAILAGEPITGAHHRALEAEIALLERTSDSATNAEAPKAEAQPTVALDHSRCIVVVECPKHPSSVMEDCCGPMLSVEVCPDESRQPVPMGLRETTLTEAEAEGLDNFLANDALRPARRGRRVPIAQPAVAADHACGGECIDGVQG